jgi:hypothetical protein
MNDLIEGSVWKHHSHLDNAPAAYTIVSVAPIKLGGTWLSEEVVTYKSSVGLIYHRLEENFRASFTRV